MAGVPVIGILMLSVAMEVFSGPLSAQSSWELREVLAPQPLPGSPDFTWNPASRTGDPDADGYLELVVYGESLAPGQHVSGVLWTYPQPFPVGDVQSAWTKPGLFYASRSGRGPQVLATPTGRRVLTERWIGEVELWDLGTGQYLQVLPPPPPPPGYPPVPGWGIREAAGDTDRDGFSDVAFASSAGGYSVIGILDGRSLAARWQLYEPGTNSDQVMPLMFPEGMHDMDQDGVGDLLVKFGYGVGEWV